MGFEVASKEVSDAPNECCVIAHGLPYSSWMLRAGPIDGGPASLTLYSTLKWRLGLTDRAVLRPIET